MKKILVAVALASLVAFASPALAAKTVVEYLSLTSVVKLISAFSSIARWGDTTYVDTDALSFGSVNDQPKPAQQLLASKTGLLNGKPSRPIAH